MTNSNLINLDHACGFGNKVKNIFKEYKFLLWAFLIPAGLTFLLYAVWQVWPFGRMAVLVLDLNGQYVYFFEELRAMVYEGRSLLYSFGRALGGEFMGIYAYYLASPLSYIVCLFPKKYICEAIYLILVLKAGFCGSAMAFYLYKTKKASYTNIIIFSTMYALCSYAIIQAHNTMWIDELFWLPLLVYGIESIIKKRKYKLYVISLAMALLSNYYIGYMMCIFTALYFFYYYFSRKDNNYSDEKLHFVKTLLRTALFTLIAIGISAIIVLSAYYSLTFGKTTFSDPNFKLSLRFDVLDLATKFFANSYDTVRPTGLPFVYCGILTLLLVPVYFMSNKISGREKIFSGILITVLVMSFTLSTVDIVWHGFQKPNWLNYRYSFMLCFFLVVLAYKAIDSIKDISIRSIFGISAFYAVLLIIIQKQDYEYLDDWFIFINLALIFMHLAILYFFKHDTKRIYALVLLIAVCAELFGNAILNVYYFDDDVVYGKRKAYVEYIDKYDDSVAYIKEYDNGEFFRMEKDDYKKTNDPMALGFYGISNSTSTLNKPVINFLHYMGYAAESHWSRYFGGTPVNDALLGIKYVIYENEQLHYPYSNIFIDSINNLYTYENPYALSLAYCVNEDIYGLLTDKASSPFDLMNKMVTRMLGSDEKIEVFKPIEHNVTTQGCNTAVTSGHYRFLPTSDKTTAFVTYELTVPNDSTIYYYFPTDYRRECTVLLNNEEFDDLFTKDKTSINQLGSFNEGEEIMLRLRLEEENLYIKSNTGTYFYYLDLTIWEEAIQKLSESQLEITSFEHDNILGNITAPEDRTTVFTSIPYDEGWRIYVDGKKTAQTKTCDALMAFDVDAGEHEIRMEYVPNCYVYGSIISIISLSLFVCICIVDTVIKKKRPSLIRALRNPVEYGDLCPDLEEDPYLIIDEISDDEMKYLEDIQQKSSDVSGECSEESENI
ncbi:MAG: hypothetical protein E7623_04655 [Ruminococcaceae bacterium]|nr:hypothetical protein [Oscillospiraceae bacterium]